MLRSNKVASAVPPDGSVLTGLTLGSCSLGGFLLAKPLREKRCVTMMDPFQAKYSRVVTVALTFASLTVEVLCLPTTMVALGVCVLFFFLKKAACCFSDVSTRTLFFF